MFASKLWRNRSRNGPINSTGTGSAMSDDSADDAQVIAILRHHHAAELSRAQLDASGSGEYTFSRVNGVRIHTPAGIGVAALAATIVVALVIAPIVLRSAGSGPGAGVAASAAPSVSTATFAQQLADGLVGGQRNGRAVAAAYVETTFGEYAGSLPDTNGLPKVGAKDDILVVEVEGWFPGAHPAPPLTSGTATSLMWAYDLTAGIDIGRYDSFDPASPDQPNASASAGRRFSELRQFGVPTILIVNSTYTTASP